VTARFERILLGTCVFAAAAWLLFYLTLALQRSLHPFELEWMEGGSLEHVMRVLRGEPLYVAPSLDFVPFPYPPFYSYLAAALSKLFAPGFGVLRGISIASSLGVALLIAAFVRRDTGRTVYGVIAAGIFLGTWRASGLYFDVARIDSLFVFLLLASLYALRAHRGRAGLMLAAVLGAFAVMTKQTGAVVLAPVALWCAWSDWRASGAGAARGASGAQGPGGWRAVLKWQRFLWFGLPLAALVGLCTLLLDGILDEHFLRYVVGVQEQHPIVPSRIGWFFVNDLLLVLPVPCAFTGFWLWRATRADRDPWDGFYAVALAGVLLACLIPRIKVGGAANNLIPAHTWLLVTFGLGIARLHAQARAARRAPSPGGAVALFALAQLLLLFRPPTGWLPTEADRAAGRTLEARVAAIEGEVLMPVQGYLAGRAGKRVYAHQLPVMDYSRSGLPEATTLLESYETAVREQRFAAIVDSNTAFLRGTLRDGLLERHYRLQGWLFEDVNVLLPISGAQIRAGTLWVPREGGKGSPRPASGNTTGQ
jgi:hypothetical protein